MTNRGPANTVSVMLGNGMGAFTGPTPFPVGNDPISVAVGDFNGNGIQDLATANQASGNASVLLGTGTGTFGPAVPFAAETAPQAVAVGDFNGDGLQDLAVANGSDTVSVLLGNGAGSFSAATNFRTGDGPSALAVGDFNGDGMQDIVTSNLNLNSVSVLLRICPPAFAIDSVTQNEGAPGVPTSFVFTVTKTGITTLTTSVDFMTQDGTATLADNDYEFSSGTLTFASDQPTATITVIVNGDATVEPDEVFTVHLSNPSQRDHFHRRRDRHHNERRCAASHTNTNPNGYAHANANPNTNDPTPTPTPTAYANANTDSHRFAVRTPYRQLVQRQLQHRRHKPSTFPPGCEWGRAIASLSAVSSLRGTRRSRCSSAAIGPSLSAVRHRRSAGLIRCSNCTARADLPRSRTITGETPRSRRSRPLAFRRPMIWNQPSTRR